ncbi:MAG: hypothetical protein K6C40_14690 [Thermoguttaceae bacterium]|nr:hypothetical protein [Thermoguttaceae bacterium]
MSDESQKNKDVNSEKNAVCQDNYEGKVDYYFDVIKKMFLKDYPSLEDDSFDGKMKEHLPEYVSAVEYILESIKIKNPSLQDKECFDLYFSKKQEYEENVHDILYSNNILNEPLEIIADKPIDDKAQRESLKKLYKIIEDQEKSSKKIGEKIERLGKLIEELAKAVFKEEKEIIEELKKETISEREKEKAKLEISITELKQTVEELKNKTIEDILAEHKEDPPENPDDSLADLRLKDLTIWDIQERIKSAYLEDYPFPQNCGKKIITTRLNDMKLDALYYCNMYYGVRSKMDLAKKLAAESQSALLKSDGYMLIINDAILKLWKYRESYKFLPQCQLIPVVLQVIYNVYYDYENMEHSKKNQKIIDDDAENNTIKNTPSTEPSPVEQVLYKERLKEAYKQYEELWNIIKRLHNRLDKKLFTNHVYRDIMILDILYPIRNNTDEKDVNDANKAKFIKGDHSEPYDSNDIVSHRRYARKAILAEYYKIPSVLEEARQIFGMDFNIRKILEAKNKPEKKILSQYIAKLNDILENNLREFYNQESAEFKKNFEDGFKYFENNSNEDA